MRFSVFGPCKGPSGYEVMLRTFLKQWYYQGHQIILDHFDGWGYMRINTDMDDIFVEMEKNNFPVDFHLNFCLLDQAKLNPNTPNYIYTMFESNKIRPEWVKCAERLDAIFVPTEWNRKVFIESGIPADKVITCPIPFDMKKITTPVDRQLVSTTFDDFSKYRHVFLHCSEMIGRKNIEGLLNSWVLATKEVTDACLVLKINSNSGNKLDYFGRKLDSIFKNRKCAPVFLITDFLSDDDMLALYQQCTHYITSSYGEGWGLSETICGILKKKVIAPNSTAFTEYLAKENAYLVDTQAVAANQDGPTGWLYRGSKWYAPIQFCAIRKIREAIEDANNADNSKETLLSEQLKSKYNAPKVAADFITKVKEFDPKKVKIEPHLEAETFNWLMICKSYGEKCGIADYSSYLYKAAQQPEAKKFSGGSMLIKGDSIDYRKVIDVNNLQAINLQLEYQFISPPRLELLLKYLKNSKIVATVTLHTVNPSAWDYHKVLLDYKTHVIVSSNRMKAELIKHCGYGSNPELVHVLPMGVTPTNIITATDSKSDKFRLGFFGFCYPHKGVDKLLQYMQQFGNGKELLLLCNKPDNDRGYFDSVKNFKNKLGNPNILWVENYLEEEPLVKMLSTCDLIVLPYSEYGGIAVSAAVRTALKAGVPIATFAASFFDDVVQEEGLIKIITDKPYDFNNWSSKLNEMIDEIKVDKDKAKYDFTVKRNKFVEMCTWDKVAVSFVQLLQGLVKECQK